MRKDAVLFGIAGVFFGVLVGWIMGAQQATGVVPGGVPASVPAQSAAGSAPQSPPPFDESRAAQLKATADQSPSDANARVQLGNLYFDAERYDDAVRWYEDALKVDPKNVNASTDLAVAYYYANQVDRALAQLDRSLKLDPNHLKSLLNQGIIRAWGKNDLAGAQQSWERVVTLAPASEEGRRAQQGLDGIKAAHAGDVGATSAAKPAQP